MKMARLTFRETRKPAATFSLRSKRGSCSDPTFVLSVPFSLSLFSLSFLKAKRETPSKKISPRVLDRLLLKRLHDWIAHSDGGRVIYEQCQTMVAARAGRNISSGSPLV